MHAIGATTTTCSDMMLAALRCWMHAALMIITVWVACEHQAVHAGYCSIHAELSSGMWLGVVTMHEGSINTCISTMHAAVPAAARQPHSQATDLALCQVQAHHSPSQRSHAAAGCCGLCQLPIG